MSARRIIGRLSRLRRARDGATAVEFALLLPFLLLLYLGGYELTQALSTYRKLTDATTQIANIVAQYTTMSALDVTSVCQASTQIMAPNSATGLKIVVTEVSTDANKNATVTWSQAYNGGTAYTAGASWTLPTGLAMASSSYVLVQTSYVYSPTIGAAYVPSITMSNKIYMLPRQSTTINYTG